MSLDHYQPKRDPHSNCDCGMCYDCDAAMELAARTRKRLALDSKARKVRKLRLESDAQYRASGSAMANALANALAA